MPKRTEADTFGDGSYRSVRGGSFNDDWELNLHAAYRFCDDPEYGGSSKRFRVVTEISAPVPTVFKWGLVTMALESV